MPIALFIAVFTGIVLSLLSSYIFTGAVPLYFVGALVGKTIMMELGPVLTGMALAGRVGALRVGPADGRQPTMPRARSAAICVSVNPSSRNTASLSCPSVGALRHCPPGVTLSLGTQPGTPSRLPSDLAICCSMPRAA